MHWVLAKTDKAHQYDNGIDDAVFVGNITELYVHHDTSTIHQTTFNYKYKSLFKKKNNSVSFESDTLTAPKSNYDFMRQPLKYKYESTGTYFSDANTSVKNAT